METSIINGYEIRHIALDQMYSTVRISEAAANRVVNELKQLNRWYAVCSVTLSNETGKIVSRGSDIAW